MLAALARSPFVRRLTPRATFFSSTMGNVENSSAAQSQVDELLSHPVVVFSKSYCPYCNEVKKLFSKYQVEYHALELDQVENGSAMQSYLAQKTGQSTVPNVFIGGVHVGGCDKTKAAIKSGQLKQLLDAAKVPYHNL